MQTATERAIEVIEAMLERNDAEDFLSITTEQLLALTIIVQAAKK